MRPPGKVTPVQSEASQQENCGGTYTILKDHDDWANLVYLGPANPGLLFPTRILE